MKKILAILALPFLLCGYLYLAPSPDKPARTYVTASGGALANDIDGIIARGAHVLNVLDWGMGTGESGTDNATAFHLAVADMDAGDTLLIPPGEFTCDALTIASGIKIVGSSYGSILKASAAVTGTFITVEAATPAYVNYFTIRDLKLDLSAAGVNAVGLKLVRAIEPEVTRVWIQGTNNTSTGNQQALVMDGTDAWAGGLRMTNCRTHGTKHGIRLTNTTTSCHVINNWILGCSSIQASSRAIYVDNTSGSGSIFCGNEIETWAEGCEDNGLFDVYSGNRFESVTLAFDLSPSHYHSLSGNNGDPVSGLREGQLALGTAGHSTPVIMYGESDPSSGSGVAAALGSLYIRQHSDLLYDDFEDRNYRYPGKWTDYNGSPTANLYVNFGIVAPAAGTRAGIYIPVSTNLAYTGLSLTEIYVEAMVRTGPNETEESFFCYTYDGTAWSYVKFEDQDVLNPRKIYTFVNGTGYTGTTTVAASTWYLVKFYLKKDAAVGVFQLWLDGNLEIDQSGINTGAAAITGFYLGKNAATTDPIYVDYVRVSSADFVGGTVYRKTGMAKTGWTTP